MSHVPSPAHSHLLSFFLSERRYSSFKSDSSQSRSLCEPGTLRDLIEAQWWGYLAFPHETERMSQMKPPKIVWENHWSPDLISLVVPKVLKATEQLWHWVL